MHFIYKIGTSQFDWVNWLTRNLSSFMSATLFFLALISGQFLTVPRSGQRIAFSLPLSTPTSLTLFSFFFSFFFLIYVLFCDCQEILSCLQLLGLGKSDTLQQYFLFFLLQHDNRLQQICFFKAIEDVPS